MLIFDTDMSLGIPLAEIDDGAALMLLLSLMGDRVAAITTVSGNTTVDNAMWNTRRLLSYLGHENIVVGRGAERALIDDRAWFAEWQAEYGETEPFGSLEGVNSAEIIIKAIRDNPHQVTIIAVGPLTNIALAMRLAPDIIPLIKEIIMMGGSLQTTEPEFNSRCDPEAASIVLQAACPIRMIGIGITNQFKLTRQQFQQLPDTNPALTLLKSQAAGWIERVEGMGWSEDGCALHDAVAVLAAFDPSFLSWESHDVTVELCGDKRGVTHLHKRQRVNAPLLIASAVAHNRYRFDKLLGEANFSVI